MSKKITKVVKVNPCPKVFQTAFQAVIRYNGKPGVLQFIWSGCEGQREAHQAGMVYASEEDAQACAERMVEAAKG